MRGVLALMNRSLRSDERLLRTHLFRFGFVLLTYATVTVAHAQSFFFGAPGRMVFSALQLLNMWCILLAAVSYFATTITEEKEEMTLGLLKMAGVSRLSLLLGKAAPRLVTAGLLLTAQLPFIMLTVTLGGVSIHQVVAAYTGLIAFLFLVACLAQLFSVISLQSRSAAFRTGLLLALYLVGPAIARGAVTSFIAVGKLNPNHWIATSTISLTSWLDSTSIFLRMQTIMMTGFAQPTISHQVVSNLSAGLIFFTISWLVFDLCTRNEKPAGPSRGLLQTRIGGRGWLGAGRAWPWAEVWKTFNFTVGGRSMVLAKLVLYALLIGSFVYVDAVSWGNRFQIDHLGSITMLTMFTALLIEIGVHASRMFRTEIKWNTLSSIYILPQSIRAMVYAKVLGCSLALIPGLVYFFIGVLFDPDTFLESLNDLLTEYAFWYAVCQYIFVVHLIALLSLYVKWGALPLAVGIAWFINAFMMSVFFRFMIVGNNEGAFVVLAVCTVIASLLVHLWIGTRLHQLSAK